MLVLPITGIENGKNLEVVVRVYGMATEATDGPSEKYKDREWLYEEYVVNDRSTVSLGNELGVAASTVSRWLKKTGIGTDPSPQEKHESFQQLKDAESLEQKYHAEGMTLAEIGDELGVCYTVVNEWFDELGIDKRGVGQRGSGDYRKLDDEQYLRDRYVESDATIEDIAAECNVSNWAVFQRLREYGIETRDRGFEKGRAMPKVAAKLANGDLSKVQDKEWLQKHYIDKEMSTLDIGEKTGLCHGTVLKYLREHGIEVRSWDEARPTGEDHHFWKGGITCEFGDDWDEKRLEARIRDQGRCQRCSIHDGEHIEEVGRVNHVHHIQPRSQFMDEDGNLNYERANELENLITLCSTCHKKLEGLPIDIRT